MNNFLRRHLDEIFLILGAGLILYGVWQLYPQYIWFAAGGMLVTAGVVIGVGQESGKTGGKGQ